MIIRTFIENFKSFRERTEFNMLAGNYKRFPEHVYDKYDGIKILKNSAVYGSNSAGKTNFVFALETLRKLVVDGTSSLKENLPYFPNKLSKESVDDKSKFEIDFLYDNIEYSYFISYKRNIVLEEWLYKNVSVKSEKIFERITKESNMKSELSLHKSLFSTKDEKIRFKIYEEELRPNQPFIFEAYNKKIKMISDAYTWFDEKLNFIFIESQYGGLPNLFAEDKWFKAKFMEIITEANIGIDSIEVNETPVEDFFGKGKEQDEIKNHIYQRTTKDRGLQFDDEDNRYCAYMNKNDEYVIGELAYYHKDLDGDLVEFKLSEESRGTRRLLDLIPAVILAAKKNSIFIVDEIECSIHPLLIRSLLKMFMQVNKDSQSQIIFSTHESNLLDLDLLRQDEIWFIEKTKEKSSNIFSLSDFKVRHDLDVNKSYLEGKFGAIPFLKQLDKMN